ncbi:MAG: ATP synthase F0 subunit B [Bdellovibrionales bacterium]|nr:ATP synthase F0 subunit B [Bdellovibrionales bacterium]
MEIFATLGINQTVFIQFGIFMIVYLVLSNMLFKPYLAAFTKRKEQTVGKTDLAERFIKETEELEAEFATKAREMNKQTKEIFDSSRTEALKKYDDVVLEARGKANKILDAARTEIETQVSAARQQLDSEIPAVTQTINAQIVGKELAQ